MKNSSKSIWDIFSKEENEDLRELFIDGLKDIYWAEQHLSEALPGFAAAATSEDLKIAFEMHFTETVGHVARMEHVFQLIDEDPIAKHCPAMEGLVEEAEEIIGITKEGSFVRDCGLIMAAQKIEHYEIGSYGSLRSIARLLGYHEAAGILQTILDEEGAADKKLTALAEASINKAAAQE